MAEINDIVLEVVLDNSFDIVEVMWSSGMAWWIASLVFCATLIGRLYLAKESLCEKGLKMPIGILVSICLVSMISFGLVVIHDLTLIESDMYDLLITGCSTFNVPNISSTFEIIGKLYTIITSTLIMFLLGWLYMWFYDKPFPLLKNKP